MAVDGKYKCVMTCTTDDEFVQVLNHYGTMELYTEDNQLKGNMFPTFFWLNAPFRCGKVDGNKFDFEVHFSTACQQYSMHVTGEVNGDEVTGTATHPMGSCVLKGIRIKE